MDGLLLDTEPLWGESMLRIAAKHQIPIGPDRFKETTGLRIYEVTEYWSVKYPWTGVGHQELAEEILEDSVNGMIAGKAARMKVIVVPDPLHFDDPRFALADAKLKSLDQFDLDLLKEL